MTSGRPAHIWDKNGILDRPCRKCGGQITRENCTVFRGSIRGTCKDCIKIEAQEYRFRRPSRNEYNRGLILQTKFNLTMAEYQNILISQNGVCAICKQINSNGRALAIDHDHKTGKIRELLCLRCNTTLGQFDDNKDLIMELINYLIKHENSEISK